VVACCQTQRSRTRLQLERHPHRVRARHIRPASLPVRSRRRRQRSAVECLIIVAVAVVARFICRRSLLRVSRRMPAVRVAATASKRAGVFVAASRARCSAAFVVRRRRGVARCRFARHVTEMRLHVDGGEQQVHALGAHGAGDQAAGATEGRRRNSAACAACTLARRGHAVTLAARACGAPCGHAAAAACYKLHARATQRLSARSGVVVTTTTMRENLKGQETLQLFSSR
jgi:hypothetical protein